MTVDQDETLVELGTAVWERLPHIVTFPTPSEYALHNISSDRYYLLSGRVAALVWDLCDGITPTSEILDRITQTFAVDRDVAWRDLRALLRSLVEQGAVIQRPHGFGNRTEDEGREVG